MTRLPVLRVATPCEADWNAMAGNDQVRFCESCGKNVYNLSAMSRAQVEALISKNEKRCVRIRKPKRWLAAAVALFLGLFGVARADTSVPKDKQKKAKAGAEKTEKEAQKKKRPHEEIEQGLLLME